MKQFILFLFILAILASCDEQMLNNSIIQPSLKSVRFSSNEHFEKINNKIPSMTEQELNLWESENSFVSYRTVLNQAGAELDLITNADEQAKFIEKYKDILTIQDSTLIPSISIFLYQSIANREGIYETAGYLNKLVGEFIVTMKREDYHNSTLSQQLY